MVGPFIVGYTKLMVCCALSWAFTSHLCPVKLLPKYYANINRFTSTVRKYRYNLTGIDEGTNKWMINQSTSYFKTETHSSIAKPTEKKREKKIVGIILK